MISIGIDVSKSKSTVCILKPGDEVLKPPFEILHSLKDIAALAELIRSYNEEVRVVLEDTGHYHLPVVSALVDNGIFVCCVNALRMQKYCAQSLRKSKTDKIDSIKIASFGLTYWNEIVPALPSDNVYQELKLLARQYYQTVSILVKAKVNLSNLLDQVMPNIQNVLQDNESNSKVALHVTRGVRWASDHVVLFDDELKEIAKEIIRNDAAGRILIGLDYFDASINRIAAWVVGARNMRKALLNALLLPNEYLAKLQDEANFTEIMAVNEELKTLPFGAVWDKYLEKEGLPGADWFKAVKEYEERVLVKRV